MRRPIPRTIRHIFSGRLFPGTRRSKGVGLPSRDRQRAPRARVVHPQAEADITAFQRETDRSWNSVAHGPPNSRSARSGAGVAVKKGAPKPDISTTEAFKRTLLAAKSIGFVEQGATGIYLKSLFQRLGIADELKPKLKMLAAGVGAGGAVAKGEVEIGMTQIPEILSYAGAELVGPLPAEIQVYTDFAVGVGANAKEPEGAKALIKFLATPAAVSVTKTKGLVPR